ncbi:hypothetical protein Mame01_68480 [Microbispora amethystogenes]|nr:hypothetical protein Mame01_68480 [Microbispora amethystogenes]
MTALAPRPTGPLAPAAGHGEADLSLSAAARAAIEAGVPASTRRAYARDWSAFTAWCSATGRSPLPATAQTVTEYVTHLTAAPSARTGRSLAPPSIERALAAICTMHQAADVDPPQTKAARKVLSGYRERLALAKDPAARPRRADAAVPDALRAMLATLDRSTLAGKRDAALLLLGYACAARVSELAALDIADVAETPDGLLVTSTGARSKPSPRRPCPTAGCRPPARCARCATWWPRSPRPVAPPGRCWSASTRGAASPSR